MDITKIEALADEAAGIADLVDAVSTANTINEGYEDGMHYLSNLMYKYAENMKTLKNEVFADAKKARA